MADAVKFNKPQAVEPSGAIAVLKQFQELKLKERTLGDQHADRMEVTVGNVASYLASVDNTKIVMEELGIKLSPEAEAAQKEGQNTVLDMYDRIIKLREEMARTASNR